ncbi:41826_t:CDS:1, partial [Gigaspora margarita]
DNLSEGRPFYEFAQAVMNDEASNRSRATSETDEPELALQSSLAINYSQEEVNNLFGINY